YRALHHAAGVFPRIDRGRLLLSGEDRRSYLQGLLSNDIAALTSGTGCYATLLTAQGRMISDMRVFELGDGVLLDLEAGVTESVRAHLDMFVITEDVVVKNVTATTAQVGLYGPEAAGIMASVKAQGLDFLYELPSSDLGIEGIDLVVPSADSAGLVEALVDAGAVLIDRETTDVTRIEAGIPRFLEDMDSTTIPLEAGIEDRAISLTKGCYVGQEIIIRVLHRGGGRVAKKLVGLAVDGSADPGDLVLSDAREVGRVTSAADSPALGKRLALAYVHRDFVQPGTTLNIKTAVGETPAAVVELPVRA
ncbi:MAG: folate-binding protein YgfZ, partial [Acidobacteria bacterium]|nr:folate-binding protein YgfZ [Acidobacteriota bacterium]